MPTNDGLCFFNDHKRPGLIALTSTSPKSHQTCYRCGSESSWVILELFIPNRDDIFTCVFHDHIHPDANLVKEVRAAACNTNVEIATPVYLKNGRDIEVWLWSFFLFHSRLRRSRNWVNWVDQQTTTAEPLRSYEQMVNCAMNHPKVFNLYYTMYQTFVPGRKYLLFE